MWEINLRQGGVRPPEPAKTQPPWGHTPSNTFGGTWGEEDDVPGDQQQPNPNMWTGNSNNPPQWNHQQPPNQTPLNTPQNMWQNQQLPGTHS